MKNGSIVWFTGAETKAEIEKVRGGSYDLAVIDECKSYAPMIIDELINDALEPATDDRAGTIIMIGTPGNILDGLFYKATAPGFVDPDSRDKRPYSRTYGNPESYWSEHKKAKPRWSRHAWTRKENTKTQENLWEAALEKKDKEQWSDDHPTWQREYLGQWVPAEDCFVYAYATLATKPDADERVHWTPKITRENVAGLPDWPGDWRFILGADLGYEDDFAVVVAAYSPTRDSLYHVWDYKANHQDFYEVVELLQFVWDKYGGFDAMVADASGLGKLVVETINKRHGLPVQPAEKREKFDHVELLNADFYTGRVKVIPGSDLARELATLQFDLSKHSKKELARTGKLRENPQLPNHLCFLPGTLITTARGLVPIEQVVAGDQVLTHRNRYQPVKAPLSREYSGEVVTVHTPAGSVTCTPEHPLWAAPVKRTPGKRLRIGGFGWVPAGHTADSAVAVGHLTAGGEKTHEALMFGYWGAEGSKSRKAGSVTWAGHTQENRIIPLLEQGLVPWGIGKPSKTRSTLKPLQTYRHENVRNAVFNSTLLLNYLEPCSSGVNKTLPAEVMTYGPVGALWCLAGYVYGDGHFSKGTNAILAASISEKLAKQVAFLARTAGIPCSIRLQKREGRWAGYGKRTRDQWTLSMPLDVFHTAISPYGELLELFKDKKNFRAPRREKAAPPRAIGATMFHTQTETVAGVYRGPVYSLSVEEDNSYVVDGLVAKNCDAFLYLHRFSNHYWSSPKVRQYAPGSEEAHQASEQRWIERVVAGRTTSKSLWESLRERSVDVLAERGKRYGTF